MPKPLRIPDNVRSQIADDIALGTGRNELARRYDVSPGLISKIARENGLRFENCTQTADSTHARQIDMWAARVDREAELFNEYLALTETTRSDGEPTRAEQRLSYALYDVNRHHNGRYR